MEKTELRALLDTGIKLFDAIDREGRGLYTKLCPHAITRLAGIRKRLFDLAFPVPLVDSENIKTAVIALDAALRTADGARLCCLRPDEKKEARRRCYQWCMLACDCLLGELEKIGIELG